MDAIDLGEQTNKGVDSSINEQGISAQPSFFAVLLVSVAVS